MRSRPLRRSILVVRVVLLVLAALSSIGVEALAQPVPPPPPVPIPEGSTASALPPAGVIPTSIALDVTGSPGTEADVLNNEILAALDRAIRPTLRPGVGIHYGAIVPWPLLPLAAGTRAAVNVNVSLSGDETTSPVSGVTMVVLSNVAVPPVRPSVLFLSDDPEYLRSEGVVFRGDVVPERPARLYYYHSDIGVPRDLDVVLTAASPARVQLISSSGGPDLDVMTVGHTVSRDFLRHSAQNEGVVIDVVPGHPFVLRHVLLLQGEVAAGAVDVHVLSGAASVSVLSSPAGSRPEAYVNGPRVAYDGHNRHGVFDLNGFGAIAGSHTVGEANTAVQLGARARTLRNLDPSDPGRDLGDYGVIHTVTFTLVNPGDTPSTVYLYEKPLGGPARAAYLIDGNLRELGCVRVPQPYWVTSYQLSPHSTGASTTLTMTDGGSFYPVEYGVTDEQPVPYTPPVGAPDGCSPNTPAFPDTASR